MKKREKEKAANKAKVKNQGKTKIGNLQPRSVRKTYKEIKREAIIRGMPFPDAVEADVYGLIAFNNTSNNKPDLSLIDKFDDWVDIQLEQAGYTKDSPMRSHRLRLGFLGEEEEHGERKAKRVPGIPKPKKPKRERDDNGLYKGTKKSYTFELASRGFSLERVVKRVTKKFPDASQKSITIWYRACIRQNKK